MNGMELKQCPFCEQYILCDENEDVIDCCMCAGTKIYRKRFVEYEKMSVLLKKLCKEGCDENMEEEIRKLLRPVSKEAYLFLEYALDTVISCHVEEVNVKLIDGTTVKITPKILERKNENKWYRIMEGKWLN